MLRAVSFGRFAPNTLYNRQALNEQLNQIRQTGIAYSMEECTLDINGVATPIMSATRFPFGALNLAIPAVTFTPGAQAKAVSVLQAASERIRRQYV
jgi:DNA-binding IclR family transcriptional regulator